MRLEPLYGQQVEQIAAGEETSHVLALDRWSVVGQGLFAMVEEGLFLLLLEQVVCLQVVAVEPLFLLLRGCVVCLTVAVVVQLDLGT